ncbi:hypothetical protein V7S43_014799 [Phytophthora oleae]|uniref:Pectate lyase n=1 Tax=Phytophthora oleae TaxID=2107226 RepID=A0ABD3F0E4_9STRA
MQIWVYGNINVDSCTGVHVTLDPANGESNLYGEALLAKMWWQAFAPSWSWRRRCWPSTSSSSRAETVHTLITG